MKRIIDAVAILALVGFVGSAEAATKSRQAWSVSRTADPITGDSSCVVTAYDRVLGMKYTRVGYLYPVVELNSKLGLLVGVSSGGRFRVPTGDVLWRVDDRPHRVLRAADNPANGGTFSAAPYKTGNEITDRAIQQAMAQTAGLMSTSTVATGEKAKEMLAEMVASKSLIFRAASAAPAYGLPSSRTVEVGQFTRDGLTPIPLDDSFRRGLAECGIVASDAAS